MKVTKEEFIKFITNYPKELEKDVTGIADPPLITYNDFSLGKWPSSVVAFTYIYEDDPDDYYYIPEEERIYNIVKEIDNVNN